MENRKKNKRIGFWVDEKLYLKVIEKARKDSVNLSNLLRNMLSEWVGQGKVDGN